MNQSGRSDITPIHVHDVHNGVSRIEVLQRIPFQQRDVDENWLQRMIYEQPGLLAVPSIESEYGPLVPLGREISTAKGPIDALYISPTGLLTIVEAKLFRNHDARRTVVGQILEYAREVSTWTYPQLDAAVKARSGTSVWNAVQRSQGDDEELDEAAFIDAAARNLRRGRFLLLIVGDGIKEEVADLAAYLQRDPTMGYTLAILELALYRGDNPHDLLVVPTLIARTREIVRAVVDITPAAEGNGLTTAAPTVRVAETTNDNGTPRSRTPLDDEVFYASIREAGTDRATGDTSRGDAAVRWAQALFEALEERGVRIDRTPASRAAKYRDPAGSGKDFTLLGIHKEGGVWAQGIAAQMRAAGQTYEGSAAQHLLQQLAQMLDRELVPTDYTSPAPDALKHRVKLWDTPVTAQQVIDALDQYLSAAQAEAAAQADATPA